MSTNVPAPMRTETYKKLIREKCPHMLETNEGQVFSSIIISLAERLDRVERENVEMKKVLGATASVVHAMIDSDGGVEDDGGSVEETVEGDGMTTAATGTAGGGGGGSVQQPPRKQDATPFPSGVPSSKAEAEAQQRTVAAAGAAPVGGPPVAAQAGAQNKTGPMDDAGDLTPNVGGGPAVNPQPIPNASAKNGRRGANA